jgi:hypothetical protein
VEPLLADTSLLRTPKFSPKIVISIQFDLRNQDTSQLRTAFVSPKGVLNFCHQGSAQKLPKKCKIVKTYWHDHSLEISENFLMVPLVRRGPIRQLPCRPLFLSQGMTIPSDLSDFPLANSRGNGMYMFEISCVSPVFHTGGADQCRHGVWQLRIGCGWDCLP